MCPGHGPGKPHESCKTSSEGSQSPYHLTRKCLLRGEVCLPSDFIPSL